MVEASRPLGSDEEPTPVFGWSEAAEALRRMRDAVDVAATAPTLRSTLRARCEQWRFEDSVRPTNDHLDYVLDAATPPILRPFITPETRIDEIAIYEIGHAIKDDFESYGDDDEAAALWFVHDHSGLSDWSLRAGIGYRIGGILIAAESRLRDEYSASFRPVMP